MSENGEREGPKSTFNTYMAEGEQLFHKGQNAKAIESFSTVSEATRVDLFNTIMFWLVY